MNEIFREGILKGRVAFVTGGGTGITGGVARALAQAGANVALASRSLEHLELAAKAVTRSWRPLEASLRPEPRRHRSDSAVIARSW